MKRHSPACDRNRDPILAQLSRWLPGPAHVLEIASGTGQHAVWFASHLPHVSWQPSDADPDARASVAAWAEEENLPNLMPPLALDVITGPWPHAAIDAVYCANMIHISPWEAAIGLFEGAGRLLAPHGLLMLYGPFKLNGAHTAPSNQDFDQDLRLRDPRWGVRDLEMVGELAQANGFDHLDTTALPANNLFVVWRKRP